MACDAVRFDREMNAKGIFLSCNLSCLCPDFDCFVDKRRYQAYFFRSSEILSIVSCVISRSSNGTALIFIIYCGSIDTIGGMLYDMYKIYNNAELYKR